MLCATLGAIVLWNFWLRLSRSPAAVVLSQFKVVQNYAGLFNMTRVEWFPLLSWEVKKEETSIQNQHQQMLQLDIKIIKIIKKIQFLYRGSPTSTVSTSTISTSTNFQKVLHKVVLVGDLISKFVLVELTVCTTQLVRISHSTIFSRSQNSY